MAQAARRTREALLKGTDHQKDDSRELIKDNSRELIKDDSRELITISDRTYPKYVLETDAVPVDWETCKTIVVVRGGNTTW